MPAYSEKDSALATKLVTFYPENKDVPTHHALIVLLEPTTGVPKAVNKLILGMIANQNLCIHA